jgi:menaquinone-dependent protoporphyrinogen oxidase
MTILVTYASRHRSTQEIGERIARKLRELGQYVDVRPIGTVSNPEGYEAFVVGGAAYYFHWMKDATRFIQHHQAILSQRPVWLFSSGPLGAEATDAQGRDVRATAEPREFAAIKSAIHPRDTRVFFGALDSRKFAFPMRLMAERLPEGDFRDWSEIDAWAESIARALTPVAATAGQARGRE